MIIGTIVVFFLIIVLPVSASHGEWGPFWLAIVIGVIVLWMAALGRKSDRAYMNRIYYWAMDGKDRAKARRRWNEEAKRDEEKEMKTVREKHEHPEGMEAWKLQAEHGVPFWERKYQVDAKEFEKPKQPVERQASRRIDASNIGANRTLMDNMFMTNNRHRSVETLECPRCKRYIRTESYEVAVEGRMVRQCKCPVCGVMIWM